MALLYHKEELHECDMKPQSESTDKIKQEETEHKPLKDSDVEKDDNLKIITVQEVKKEEEEGEWDAELLGSPMELNTDIKYVHQGLNSAGRPSDSGLDSKEENHAHSAIHNGEKSHQCAQCGKNFFREVDLKSHARNGDCSKQTPTGKEYCCSHCGKTFVTLIHFIVHQQIHRGDGKRERPFCCSQCGKSFYKEKGLETHQQSHKAERPHSCSKCGKSFPTKSFLLSHQRSHTRKKLYHCPKCGRSFASKTNFERHKETIYSCSQTENNCLTECGLNRHKQAHSRKKTTGSFQQLAAKKKLYSCSHCERTFTVLSNFIVHQQIHRGEGREERPFWCSHCGKSFYKEDGLKRHQQTHTGERLHCCSQCGKSFRSKAVLLSHKRAHMKERLYHCSKCARSFTLKGHFEKHMQVHAREGQYNGSSLGERFPAAYCLNRHKQKSLQPMPSKTKSYGCSHCGKTFTDLTNFIVHQQIHRGEGKEERPFCCSECGKCFYREDGLKKHQQMHTGEKAHHCSQCGKSFRTKYVLQSHQNTHANERLYRGLKHAGSFVLKGKDTLVHPREKLHNCSQCGKIFSTEHCLKRHKQTHTPKSNNCFKQIPTKKYCCSNCGKIFTTLTNFIVHQQIHRGQGRRDSRLEDSRPMSAKNLGGKEGGSVKNAAGVVDGGGERDNTSHFKSLPGPGKDDHSIEKINHLKWFSDVGKLETHIDTAKKPLMACDVVSPFHPKVTGGTPDCIETGSTSAGRDEAVKDGTSRKRPLLSTHNAVSSFAKAERPTSSWEITLIPSEEESREFDMKKELKHDCEWELESESLNAVKQENHEHMPLTKVEEDHQPQDSAPGDMKKEEVEVDCDFGIVSRATELNNMMHFNQEIVSVEGQSHSSSCLKNVTTERNLTLHQQNQIEKIYTYSQGVESLKENNTDTHLQSYARKKQQIQTGNKTYCCSHCGRTFNALTKYIVHLQIHRRDGKEERPFSCSQCGKRFYKEEGLKTHQQYHVGERPDSSPQSRKPGRTSDLTSHQHKHAAERQYHCHQCDKIFIKQSDFWEHQQSHSEASCSSYCGEIIVQDSILKQYQTTHTNTTAGFAPTAPNGHLSGQTQRDRYSHSDSSSPGAKPLMVDPQPPFYPEQHFGTGYSSFVRNADVQTTCNIDNGFGTEEMARRTEKTPLFSRRDQSVKCVLEPKLEPHCDQESESLEQIKQEDNGHKLMAADCMEEDLQLKIITLEEVKTEAAEGERDSLEITGKLNKGNQSVTCRMRVAERQNGSSACGTSFATDGNFGTLSLHTEEKTYQCSHCEKSFIREDDLEKHQRIHTRESVYFQQIPSVTKSYSCARCEKSFATITNYFVHLQIHRGERPFSCSQCGKSYYKEESLKTHQLTHAGGKH